MSGIAGIYNLDGRPADAALLNSMTDIIAHRGPDEVGYWIDGPVGLGHRMLHTTPESLMEKQPLTDETGNLCLTLDGRVDNREELTLDLKVKGMRLRDDTDAELVLRAYQCWGEECPKRIIGDFAFVIWDRLSRQLFCARDFMGIRPFHYYTNGRTFLCGSELRQLFEDAAVPCEPNEGMIGEYLASVISNSEETLYRDIFRLPPAHFLLVQPGRLRKGRFWDIDPARAIRYRKDEEYAEHFLDIFKKTVRCRSRCNGRIGAELSGGLDSSSVVGVYQLLKRDGVVADSGFETFSMVYPGLPCDESNYIQDVVRKWNLDSNIICPDQPAPHFYADLVRCYREFPDYPNGAMSYSLWALAREKGFRVIFTGCGGDHWLVGSNYHYADLLRQFRIPSLIHQVRYNSGKTGMIFPVSPLLKLGLWPLIPRPARQVIKWLLRRNGTPAWIDKQFVRKIQLTERLRRKTVSLQFSSFAMEDLYYNSLMSGFDLHIFEILDRSISSFNIEQRHPFLDRRIVEYAFSLPEDQRRRKGKEKFILRRAMRTILPETIRQRLTEADFSHSFGNSLQAPDIKHLFSNLTIASMGWVDEDQVYAMYRQMEQLYIQGNEGYIKHIWPLWIIYGIELWFRIVFLNSDAFNEKGLHSGVYQTQI
jgi:asparagine synthase (glutamine-hydrolysing)